MDTNKAPDKRSGSKIVVPGIQKDEKAIDIDLSWLKSLNNNTILCYTDGSKQASWKWLRLLYTSELSTVSSLNTQLPLRKSK